MRLSVEILWTVIPAQAGISGGGAGKEPHEIPAFAGMTVMRWNGLGAEA